MIYSIKKKKQKIIEREIRFLVTRDEESGMEKLDEDGQEAQI